MPSATLLPATERFPIPLFAGVFIKSLLVTRYQKQHGQNLTEGERENMWMVIVGV